MPKQSLFVLTHELQQALENLPKDERRCSSLEPFRAIILRWRREGRTYRRICQILHDECQLKVAYGTLHEFVQRRSKPRKPKPEEPETDQLDLAAEGPAGLPPAAFTPGTKRLTPEERQAQVEFIRSLNQPTSEQQPEKPRWHFDVDKPRTLHKP
jgi:hypothetical protein